MDDRRFTFDGERVGERDLCYMTDRESGSRELVGWIEPASWRLQLWWWVTGYGVGDRWFVRSWQWLRRRAEYVFVVFIVGLLRLSFCLRRLALRLERVHL